MKIFSNEQIRSIEQYTIEHDGVSPLDLIGRAAAGIADEIAKRWDASTRTVAFCGWGNNGADGLDACRLLMRKGFSLEIHLFNIGGQRLSPECVACRDRLLEEFPDCRLNEIRQTFEIPDLDSDCLVIDAIFGSGLNRPLPQSLSMLVRAINDSDADIVAIDLPSGLQGEWNANTIYSNIIHATLTIAIGFPRLAFFIDDNSELVGDWVAVNIGLNPQAVRATQYPYYLITDSNVRRILRPRRPEYTKADYGSALICAGSHGMMGAAVLATRACLRAGVGKVTCYSPRCGYYVMQTAVPCAMFLQDPHDASISDITLQRDYHAVAIGPGIGTNAVTINALDNFLRVANANGRPLVLDADALNCIALRPIMLNYVPVMSVITPHVGEFDRLFGDQPSHEARLRKAIEVAREHNIVVVLKGRYTAVVRPDGKVHINSSGTPALATAGSGDVLTGIITSFMAQGYSPEMAAILGVYIHGAAGILCEERHGAYGTIASDIADAVGRAITLLLN